MHTNLVMVITIVVVFDRRRALVPSQGFVALGRMVNCRALLAATGSRGWRHCDVTARGQVGGDLRRQKAWVARATHGVVCFVTRDGWLAVDVVFNSAGHGVTFNVGRPQRKAKLPAQRRNLALWWVSIHHFPPRSSSPLQAHVTLGNCGL